MLDIKVYINNSVIFNSTIINVSDRDAVEFEISSESAEYLTNASIELYLEDYVIPFVISSDGLTIKTQANHLFRESFGYSNVRLFVDDALFTEIVFNVSTNEERFNSIKGMMSYLLDNNDRILDICFSRTKYKAKNDGEYNASFDSVISLAETIVNSFEEKKSYLSKELRHRLELVKESANERNYYNINPYDVIENLDQIYQGYSPNSLNLFGKVYSLDNIQRENHIDSYDVVENHILLGGLISIKETMIDILKSIEGETSQLTYDQEYKTIQPYYKLNSFIIEDLYVQLTTAGMSKRIESILSCIDELLYIFRNKLRVSFKGYVPPNLTPYAKKSGLYLKLYTYLNEWYSLGSPDIGVNQDLTKIRSTTKIYELFTLYKLIDELYVNGWQVTKSVEHSIFKRFIPSQVEFKKDDTTLILYYEKKVFGFSEYTQHNDLVALNKNSPRNKYNYYNPDFLLVRKENEAVSYYILDSKYSTSKTLHEYSVLDNLFDKYFINLATYNSDNKVLDKSSIKCVIAVHPFGGYELNKWPQHLPTITPMVSSILLSQDRNNLGTILDRINEGF